MNTIAKRIIWILVCMGLVFLIFTVGDRLQSS